MKQTIAEKSFPDTQVHSSQRVYRCDGIMAIDATAPFALQAQRRMSSKQLWDSRRVSLVIGHASPAPNETVVNLHQLMRDFGLEMGCHLYDVGGGICHQLMVENAHVHPGDLFLGVDSHSTTYGAINALGIGVGSTDVAYLLKYEDYV